MIMFKFFRERTLVLGKGRDEMTRPKPTTRIKKRVKETKNYYS